MKKILFVSLISAIFLFGNDAKVLFETKCMSCHKVEVKDKNSLIAPPISKVVKHLKSAFKKDKNKSIEFVVDYVYSPDPNKTICPSIDIFGVMPSLKGSVTKEELIKIANYIYDNFPKANMKKPKRRGRVDKKFMMIDKNRDGFISKYEFNRFRAFKEGIDIDKIKYDYFFRKIDLDKDGKLNKDEFIKFHQMIRGI